MNFALHLMCRETNASKYQAKRDQCTVSGVELWIGIECNKDGIIRILSAERVESVISFYKVYVPPQRPTARLTVSDTDLNPQ